MTIRGTLVRSTSLMLRRVPWLPNGMYTIWRRLRAQHSVGAVGVIVNRGCQILLVEHAFHAQFPWGLPGGWVGRDENPAEAVRREIREELSLDVRVGPKLLIEQPHSHHIDLAYLCYAEGTVGILNYEVLAYDWFSPDELPKLLGFHRRAIQQALVVTQL